MMQHRPLRRKAHLVDVLTQADVEFGKYDYIDALVERVLRYVPASQAISNFSPRFGLNSDQLSAWCRQMSISPSGPIEERATRIIEHFDQLRPRIVSESDEREVWYRYYEELADRNHEFLRAQHVIDKDLEIEAKFEDATSYLFEELLNHTPLQQRGTAHPDGLLSLRMDYLMRDNKSKQTPVNLKDHVAQFDGYMNQADKPVPVFLVIGPEFTEDSEVEAIRYHAQNFNRNLVLITAKELKSLAEEWSSASNKQRDTGFNLGLLAATGRFKRERLGKLT